MLVSRSSFTSCSALNLVAWYVSALGIMLRRNMTSRGRGGGGGGCGTGWLN